MNVFTRGVDEVSSRPDEFLKLVTKLQNIYNYTPFVELNNATLRYRVRMCVRGKTVYSKDCDDALDALNHVRVKLIAMFGPECDFVGGYVWKSRQSPWRLSP